MTDPATRDRHGADTNGADDAHDYIAGVPRGRTLGPLGSPSWNAEYRRRVDGVTREFNAAGISTVWLGLPIPSGSGYARSFPVVNAILGGQFSSRINLNLREARGLTYGARTSFDFRVRSGTFSFRITRLVLPEGVAPDASLRDRTRFELPFDHPKKPSKEAYAEVKTALSDLDETTLLFLSNLKSIKWISPRYDLIPETEEEREKIELFGMHAVKAYQSI